MINEQITKESRTQVKKNYLKTFLVGTILATNVLAAIPFAAQAYCEAPLVLHPQTGTCVRQSGGSGLLGASTITGLIIGIINILLAIAFIIAVFFVVIGGYRYLFSGGNEEGAKAGRTTLTNAVIGLVIVILSYVIVNIVNNTLGSGGAFGGFGGNGGGWNVGGTIGSDGSGGVQGGVGGGGWFGF